MAKDIKRHVTHIKSKVIESNWPKLPAAADLLEGEIAVNYAKGLETLSIKNESGDVVTFTPSQNSRQGETIHYLTSPTGAAGGTNLSASWSGNSTEIKELYDGLVVQIKIPSAGHASGVTLSINGGDKHPIMYNNSRLTTHYVVNSVKIMTYDANASYTYYSGSSTAVSVQGVWRCDANYYSDTDTKVGQKKISENNNRPILLKFSADTTDQTNEAKYASGVTVNTSTNSITASGTIQGGTIKKSGGTATQFLMADGTVNSTVLSDIEDLSGQSQTIASALNDLNTNKVSVSNYNSDRTDWDEAALKAPLYIYSAITANTSFVSPISASESNNGKQAHIIYHNTGSTQVTVTITKSTTIKTPTNANISLNIPGGAYAEVNCLVLSGLLFVRGC